jgi:ribosomal protein S27AE
MPDGVNIKLDSELISFLDKRRGDLTIDEFIIRILHEHLKKVNTGEESEENFIDLDSEPEDNEKFLRKFMKDFQEFTENINTRLEHLEGLVSNIPPENSIEDDYLDEEQDIEDYTETDDELSDEKESYSVEDQNGEPMIFELVENDEDNFEPDEEPAKYDPDRTNIDEFEYGCPYCNATIASSATFCPSCGNRFDDSVESYTPRREAVVVEPLSDGYSESGSYDPRPGYMKKSRPRDLGHGEMPSWQERRSLNQRPVINQGKLCANCGNKLTYFDDYKRWYCFKCKRYEGAQVPRVVAPPRSGFEDRPQGSFSPRRNGSPQRSPPPREVIEDDNRDQRKTFQRKSKPLKDYPKYGD